MDVNEESREGLFFLLKIKFFSTLLSFEATLEAKVWLFSLPIKKQTADYTPYTNTLKGYKLANSNYQFTS